jgi:hypothetical protein
MKKPKYPILPGQKMRCGQFAVCHTGPQQYKVIDLVSNVVRSTKSNLSTALGDAQWFYKENLEDMNDYLD